MTSLPLNQDFPAVAIDGLFHRTTPVVERRAVHLDLKGCPPTPARLLSLLDLFAAARYNAVLVEWEDRFPWVVDTRFRHVDHYGNDDIAAFHRRAAELGLEVIPLVQTLGHMETVLSVPDYHVLREAPDRADGLNPLAPGAAELVAAMIDEVLARTPDARHFHIGCDEAWTFGTHPDTRAFVAEHGAAALFLRFVEPILDRLLARGVRPLIWHDMIRTWEPAALRRLAGKADVVAWGYQGSPRDVTGHYSIEVVERLASAGVTLWAGAAYKGPDGFSGDVPDAASRVTNAVAWMEIAERLKFKGVIATGWSRNNTHTPQKAPIDAALDVLAAVAVVLHDGAPPARGRAACLELLAAAGERERFERCHEVMHLLHESRRLAWIHVQRLHEQIALAHRSGRDTADGMGRKFWQYFRTHLQDAEAAGRRMPEVFAGLMPPAMIDEYLAVRLQPLRDQHALISQHMRAYSS